MQVETLTHSALGLPLISYRWKKSPTNQPPNQPTSKLPKVLILGGVHGDEIEGVWAAQYLLSEFQKNFSYNLDLTLIPIFNPDGVFQKTRTNSNGVDLNRNLPTKDWSAEIKTLRYHPGPSANSELENQALVAFLEKEKPDFILSLHSWHPLLNINGDCKKVAEVIAQKTGYKIEESIGYPTPGCLGTFAGLERSLPTLTYEIERGLGPLPIKDLHVPAILAALKVLETP